MPLVMLASGRLRTFVLGLATGQFRPAANGAFDAKELAEAEPGQYQERLTSRPVRVEVTSAAVPYGVEVTLLNPFTYRAAAISNVSGLLAVIGLIALAIGLLAQLLFVDAGLGINVPIATAALLLAGWVVRDPGRPAPRPLDAWLAPGALILSAFVALRGDGTLVALDILGAIALSGAALVSFGGLRVLERPFAAIIDLAGRLALSGMVAAIRPFAAVVGAVPSLRGTSRSGSVAAVLRGLLLAVPLVILFVALFSSADAVFARITGDVLGWNLDLGSLPARLAVAGLVAWVAAGLLAFVAKGGNRPPRAATDGARRRLGSAEAVTVLVVLDLLFVAFVVLQATYLFGGRDTLEASGLTYAEYARRGFFELLAVAFLVGWLILAMEAFVRSRSRAYVTAAIGLVVLTIVVLASAFLRLRLYQDAYGWTELRFYVLAAIAWLAIGALMASATLARDRTRWLLHGMLALSFAFGLAFNVIGPVRFITEQNIQRAIHPDLVAPGGETGLDVYYLASLGDDALSVLVDNHCKFPLPEDEFNALAYRADRAARDDAANAWQAWNLSHEFARDLTLSRFCLTSAP